MAAKSEKPKTPPTAEQEAEALLAELEHPQKTDETAESEETPAEKTVSVIGATFRALFNWLITPFAIVVVLHFFVFQAYQVVGSSMNPTLQNSDYLIISKLGATFAKAKGGSSKHSFYIPKRGEVVVFIAPPSPSQTFVKRVVGLPGERVVVKDGKVTVFNKQHPEGFDPDSTHQVSSPITLGEDDEIVRPGNLYVVGDNRLPSGSYDSREWGQLPAENIIGVAILRLLPVTDIKFLSLPLVTPALLQRFGQPG